MSTETNKLDFLFELGCEELPPKALTKLAQSLHENLKSSFDSLGLTFVDSEWFATPRRLAVRFIQLDASQKDKQIEKLGPATAAAFDQDGKPKPAAIGFAKSHGVEVIDLDRKQTKKGERLAYIANLKGKQTKILMQELLQKAIAQLPVPKTMRWGNENSQFSRPVHWVLAILGEEVLPVKLFDQTANNLTFGHRFHSPEAIEITNASEYEQKLALNNVIACFEERKARIRIQVEKLAKKKHAIAVISEELLEEVTALVEWPVPLLGNFDESFLEVPSEALISSMVEHQKYFHLIDSQKQLLPYFITVSNIESKNPTSVIEGNEKVIRPRLADAKFFYDSDCKNTLESYVEKLKKIVFQNKLGSLYAKTQRIKILAVDIAEQLNSDKELVARAAELCKCDLMTNMVGEFSDLQGVMGRYYATKDGEHKDVAESMDEIYMPRFAGDQLPKTSTGLILALAERVDTLVGIFGIGQIPTGAKDPFALRRSALGVLRLITENNLTLDLAQLITKSIEIFASSDSVVEINTNTDKELMSFFNARTSAMYQEKGFSSQAIKAVQALNISRPTDFYNRLKAVKAFDSQAESADLAEANKRVKNILAKSDFNSSTNKINTSLFESDEKALFETIQTVKTYVDEKVSKGDYALALSKLASLKDVVNQFFDNVMINVDDLEIKNNRLALINELRNLFIGIADISLLQK